MYYEVLIFRKSDGGRIKLDRFPLKKIYKHIQKNQDMYEAGGVLLGRYIIDSNDIVIDDITTPMKNDIRHRFYFLKRKREHQKIVTKRWYETKGTCNYLGEWHTHPEAVPNHSIVDLNEWKRLLKITKFDGTYLYFIIAGMEQLKIWEGNRYSLEFTLLEQIDREKGEEH